MDTAKWCLHPYRVRSHGCTRGCTCATHVTTFLPIWKCLYFVPILCMYRTRVRIRNLVLLHLVSHLQNFSSMMMLPVPNLKTIDLFPYFRLYSNDLTTMVKYVQSLQWVVSFETVLLGKCKLHPTTPCQVTWITTTGRLKKLSLVCGSELA